MKRKNFLRLVATIPLLHLPFKRSAFAKRQGCKTQKDVEGPFYKSDAPARAVIHSEGEPLIIEGKVFSSNDCKTPVKGALLDIWHCDNEGNYDMSGYSCRGKIKTDDQGSYTFSTIFPPPYGTRPRHIHIKVSARNHAELTTQLYFQGDPQIKNDFARDADQRRVISLTVEKGVRKGTFNIYV